MFALLFEDSNCADCCGFMSAFIRQCWICHYIINILNNVIKLLEAPLPVSFDPSYEKEHGAAFGADFISIKSCFVYLFYLSYFPPVYVSILAISTLCLFSINAALKKQKKKDHSCVIQFAFIADILSAQEDVTIYHQVVSRASDICCQSTKHINIVCSQHVAYMPRANKLLA